MTDQPPRPEPFDAVTTPAGIRSTCPHCGVSLDALSTACTHCGAVITGGGPAGERAERLRQRVQAQIGSAYQLGAVIGRGGMGIVFRAREVSLDREVALKVLAFDALMNPDAFERFEREAKLAARLDHPNIVPIFAVGQGDGAAYYTMRFVKGGSLETLLADKGALGLDDAVRLLRDVASALDYAHRQGIVHRDIKPANILLSESGHAMVADFGIARAFTGDAVTSTSGSHTGVVGSPAYMAPEQWRGDKPDGRADQYALGVLAFELLSGQRPFRDVSMQELLRLHLGEAPPDIESVRTGLPRHVGQAIRRAMSKDPADRFASATAFVTALSGESAVGGLPQAATKHVATTPGRAQRTQQWMGNALAAVMVITAATFGAIEWRRAQQAPPSAAVTSDTLAERLARELEETRKIALDAQRRAERAEAEGQARDRAQSRSAAVRAAAGGHVAVAVRGGAPRLLIDGKESAVSTPAIIEVPLGRHIVRVEETGRQYQPAQYVIDVSEGDTSKLVFSDVRANPRDFVPFEQQMQQLRGQGGGARFTRPRFGDSTAAGQRVAGDPSAANAVTGAADTTTTPFYLPSRIWRNMSAQEQEMLRGRWNRMSPEQQRNAFKEFQQRDSSGGLFPRRSTQQRPQAQQPPQPPPAPAKP